MSVPLARALIELEGDDVIPEALYEAVRDRSIRAGLDVFTGEPSGGAGTVEDRIFELDGVIGTHHIGASTDQAQQAIADEIDAANLIKNTMSSPRDQVKLVWPASFVVARAYLDQLDRMHGLASDKLSAIRGSLDAAEHMNGAPQRGALQKLAKQTEADAKGAQDADRVHWLAGTLKDLATVKSGG